MNARPETATAKVSLLNGLLTIDSASCVAPMKTPRLLVVDDEFGVRESLKLVFGREFRLLEAESVDAAMALVRTEKPQIVLLDVVMPKTDGLEVLKSIKAIHPDCEVIMLSGLNSQQLATQAMNLGAFDFIGKPFDVVALRHIVKQALEKNAEKFQA